MSDVLVRGMEMPKTCGECNYCHYLCGYYSGYYCRATNQSFRISADVEIEKPHGCPLVEILPHGRLIDADELMIEVMDSDLDHLQRDDWKEVIQIVNDAPTIIEAEGSNI